LKIKISYIIVVFAAIIIIFLSLALRSQSAKVSLLRLDITLAEQLINKEEAAVDSMNIELGTLDAYLMAATERVNELVASRSWWFRKSLESDAQIEDILDSAFTGPDSLLAYSIYKEWRISTGRATQ
tara:strand:- start:7754 stop:8134 length:381 start_codon:yes stop_codon:yes gene_type:complete